MTDIHVRSPIQVKLPDVELYINLGDYPLVTETRVKAGQPQGPVPIFSWCGSDTSRDIVMPTYKVTESTLYSTGMPG